MKTKNKKVLGIAVNDFSGPCTNKEGKHILSYSIWMAMIKRCYSDRVHSLQPTYIGCSVCDEWLYFSNFKKWFDNNYIEGCHLDKDILVKGNKVYGPDTCCFVPQRINSMLINCKALRGKCPVGVYYHKASNKFLAKCNHGTGKQIYLGVFTNSDEAFRIYKVYKESVIKQVALEAFANNQITKKVRDALLNYSVEIGE